MLTREGLVDAWHERRIIAGSNIDSAISDKLKYAAKMAPNVQLMEYRLAETLAPIVLKWRQRERRILGRRPRRASQQRRALILMDMAELRSDRAPRTR